MTEPRMLISRIVIGLCLILGRGAVGADSPLHDFLGIDERTGEFKPEEPVAAPQPTDDADQPATAVGSPGLKGGEPTGPESRRPNSAGTGPRSSRDPVDQAIETRDAFRRATERLGGGTQLGDGALDDLAGLFGESLQSHPLWRWHQRIVWITVALFMIYPASLIMSEVVDRVSGWGTHRVTDADRQFARTRMRQRLILAAALTAVILIAGYASVQSDWLTQPGKLVALAAVLFPLGVLAVSLKASIGRSADRYQLDLLREIRHEQLELRVELEELRIGNGGGDGH